jgi:hypothetical protein
MKTHCFPHTSSPYPWRIWSYISKEGGEGVGGERGLEGTSDSVIIEIKLRQTVWTYRQRL